MKRVTIIVLLVISSICGYSQSCQIINSIRDTSGSVYAVSGSTYDVAMDNAGNLYSADYINHRIRKVTPGGIATTIAGTYGVSGFSGDGGPATAALINQPLALTVDAAGNVIFADQNYRIRKINLSGIISTVAGTGVYGFSGDGGPATAAKLYDTYGLATDLAGNIYFSNGARIRKVSTAGIITTFAGNGFTSGLSGDGGPATAAALGPTGVTIDVSGNIYIADNVNACIRKINTSGIITTIAGSFGTTGYSGDGGPATAALLNQPWDLTVDGTGDIYFSDMYNRRIRKIKTTGIILTVAGTGTNGYTGDCGPATAATLSAPAGICMYGTTKLAFADCNSNVLRTILLGCDTLSAITGVSSLCAGSTSLFTNSSSGGTWSSSNTAIATVGSTGLVTGISSGAATITYTNSCGTSYVVKNINICTTPNLSSHFFTDVCAGSTSSSFSYTTLSATTCSYNLVWDATAHSAGFVDVGTTTFTSSPLSISVPPSASPATYNGVITLSNVCNTVSYPVTLRIQPLPSVLPIGNQIICNGYPTLAVSFTGSIPGSSYFWTNSNATIGLSSSGSGNIASFVATNATTSSQTGVITVTPVYNGCIGLSQTFSVTVLPSPVVGIILGSSHVAVGSNIALTDTTSGGVWSSTNPSVTIVGSTGIVTGVSLGIDTIKYTVTNSCGTAVATKVVTVTPLVSVCNIINTIAGSSAGFGGDGGPATASRLYNPYSICKDNAGNTYIADDQNNRVRKINASGFISTFAGNGIAGFGGDGGAATAAQLHPTAIAADISGNIYISDLNNSRIRKVNTAGVITTIAGNGIVGSSGDGGPATAATINEVWGLMTDSSGNVYLSDWRENRIRKINPSGTISTIAGNGSSISSGDGGPATAAGIYGPTHMSRDLSGNIYVAENSGNRVRKISPSGIITTCAGTGVSGISGIGGPATAAQLNAPRGVLADNVGNVYIACNNLVEKVDNDGIITIFAGSGSSGFSGDGGPATAAKFAMLSDIIVNDSGSFLVCDWANNRIRKIDNSTYVGPILGSASVCIGATATLTNSVPGGVWTSSDVTIATVGSASGIVSGITTGSVTIKYQLTNFCGTTFTKKTITVNPAPAAIIGPTSLCTGSTATFFDSTSGGTWSSNNTTVATIGSTSGIMTGVAAGTAVITYTTSGGCYTATPVTVQTVPAVPTITGTTTICVGSTTALSNTMPGGYWYSTDVTIATVSSTGLVTGVSNGSVAIVYAVAGICGIGFNSVFVNVNNATPITGPLAVCLGSSVTLSNSTSGGVWSSSNSSIASVGSSTGVVAGVAIGSATITYSLSPGCYSTKTITVNAGTATITGAANVCVSLSTTLTGFPSGGIWSSSNTTVATVGSSTGTITGITAGSVNITYTLTSGCFTVKSVTVTTSAGSITGIPGACPGSTTTLTGPVPGGIWTSGSTFYATIGSSSGVVTGVSPGTSLITYSVGTGCNSTITVSIHPTPVVIPITGGGTMCAGGPGISIGMSASAVGINYQLLRGGAPVGSALAGTGSALSFGPQTIAGVYTITGTDALTLCQSTMSGSANITVYSAPTITVGGSTAICAGASTTLSASGGLTYTWSPAAGLSSTAGASVVASPTVTTTYTVTGVNSTGCTNTATVTITVNPIPVVTAGSGVSICSGSSTTLTASGGTSYTWSPGTGLSSTVGSSVTATPTTTTTYTVTGTNSYGCSNKATVTVTVNSSPAISAGSSTAICNGGSTTLTASGGTTYIWSPATGLSATTGASVTASPTATNTYLVTGTNSGGCSNTATVTVSVNPLPTVSAGSGVAVCAGTTTVLSGSGATTYTWSPGTGLSSTAGATVTANPTTTTTFTVTGTNSYGCNNNATVTVTVNTSPAAISSIGSVCIGTAALLTNATSGGVWTSSNTSVATIGSGSGIITGVAMGSTTISYTLSSGCSATLTVNVVSAASSIAGPSTIYTGATATYTNSTGGGSWSSSNTSVLSIGSSSGIATGVAVGSATITYSISLGCRSKLPVTVTSTPIVYSVTGGGTYCSGGTATPIGLSGSQVGVSYQLYLGSTLVGSAVAGTGSAITFGTYTAAGTYTATAYITGYTPVAMSGSAIVTVIPSTALPALISVGGGGSFCAGSSGVAVNLPSGSAVTVNYQLYRNGVMTGSPVPGTGMGLSFGLQTLPGSYTVIGTSTVNGCARAMSGCANVTVYTVPNVYSVTGGGSYCAGGAGVLLSLSNSQSGINYQKYNGTTPTGISYAGTGSALSLGYATTAGTYTIVGTNASTACQSTMTGTASVGVTSLPTITSSTFFVAPTTSITLTGSPSGGNWSTSTPTIISVGSSSGVVTGVSIGTGSVTYTASGCTNTHLLYVTATGHKSAGSLSGGIADDDNIVVIPNPSKGVFTIKGTIGEVPDEMVLIQITNMLGQLIYNGQTIKNNNEINEQIKLSGSIANGMYLLKVTSGDTQKQFHIVIEQ